MCLSYTCAGEAGEQGLRGREGQTGPRGEPGPPGFGMKGDRGRTRQNPSSDRNYFNSRTVSHCWTSDFFGVMQVLLEISDLSAQLDQKVTFMNTFLNYTEQQKYRLV